MYEELPFTREDHRSILNLFDVIDSSLSLKSAKDIIVKELLEIFRAESAIFFIRDLDSCSFREDMTAFINLKWRYVNQYIDYYNQADPFSIKIPGVYARRDIDFMPLSEMLNHEFYNDFIKPQGISRMILLCLHDDNYILGHIVINRHNKNGPPFSLKDLAKARFLAKLLSFSLKQKQLLEKHTTVKKVFEQIGEPSSKGIIILNKNMSPIYWNSKASKICLSLASQLRRAGDGDGFWAALPPGLREECLNFKKSLQCDGQGTKYERQSAFLHTSKYLGG